jgi:hypothetical protein
MHTETVGPGTAERKSFGKLLSQLSSDSVALFRDELELARQEMREKVKILETRIALIVIGAMVGQIALMMLGAAAVIKLADSVGFGASALIIGMGLALIGGGVALFGLRQLRRTSLKPEKTIQTLKEGKAWMKEAI